MLCCFAALYWIVDYSSPLSANENQSGIPKAVPDYNDSKTTLVVLDSANTDFFFLVKLNALQNKVGIVTIPSDFYLSAANRTMADSMAYAGIMQCVQDVSEQFDISVDHHLLVDSTALCSIMSGFSPLNSNSLAIPQSVKEYLLSPSGYTDISALVNSIDLSAPMLDNPIGREFLNLAATSLVENNMQNICDSAIEKIKENSSFVTTNIGTQEADRLRRIVTFLINSDTQFDRLVLADPATAQQEIDTLLKE